MLTTNCDVFWWGVVKWLAIIVILIIVFSVFFLCLGFCSSIIGDKGIAKWISVLISGFLSALLYNKLDGGFLKAKLRKWLDDKK